MPDLFSPLQLRSITFPNRIGISPMCQYSSTCDGGATPWHIAHLGTRAVGGAGMVMVEATSVMPEGRLSPQDMGIWSDSHIAGLGALAAIIRDNGAVPAIQIGHAGRKASVHRPWDGGHSLTAEEGAWPVVGPSAIRFSDNYPVPHELTVEQISDLVDAFGSAAIRADQAGFDLIELHGAHGYLICSFLCASSNHRVDQYGGSLENRARFLIEIIEKVRSVWPQSKPLAVRLSCSEWVPGGWSIDDSVALVRLIEGLDVDLIDCSSGGNHEHQQVSLGPGYQVPFAEQIRRETNLPTAAVGLISEAVQANLIIVEDQADLVLLGRESLRSPYWPRDAARQLGMGDRITIPDQYHRGW